MADARELLEQLLDDMKTLEPTLQAGGPRAVREWAMQHFQRLVALDRAQRRTAAPAEGEPTGVNEALLEAFESIQDQRHGEAGGLQAALGALVRLTGAARGFIAIPAPNHGLYFPAAVAFSALAMDAPEAEISRSILDVALAGQGRSFSIDDAKADSRFVGKASVHRLALRAVLVVPLPDIDGEVFGVLYLDNPTQAAAFDDARRRAAETFAGVVAPQLARAQQRRRDGQQLERRLARIRHHQSLASLAGASAPFVRTLDEVVRLAPMKVPVLIVGEPGAGKTRLARALHAVGEREFETVDCRRPNLDLVTGAAAVVLEDLDALPPEHHAPLLDALDANSLRVVSTSRRRLDLGGELDDGLVLRLCGVVLSLAPLRDRMEDLPGLVRAVRMEDQPHLSLEVQRAFEMHPWPGNLTELRDVLEFAGQRAKASNSNAIRVEHLPPGFGEGDDLEELRLKPAVRAFRMRYVQRVLDECDGEAKRAAGILGVHPKYIYKLLRDLEDEA